MKAKIENIIEGLVTKVTGKETLTADEVELIIQTTKDILTTIKQ